MGFSSHVYFVEPSSSIIQSEEVNLAPPKAAATAAAPSVGGVQDVVCARCVGEHYFGVTSLGILEGRHDQEEG